MNVSRGLMALSSAAVLAAIVCTPVSANESSDALATEAMEEMSSKSPIKVRRTWVRKRVVVASRAPRVVARAPQEVSLVRPNYQRVAIHLPIILGIGF